MRDSMLWRNARTGRVICQCAARVNLFLCQNRFFGVIIPDQSLRGKVPKLCRTAID